jgi:putative membrane protein
LAYTGSPISRGARSRVAQAVRPWEVVITMTQRKWVPVLGLAVLGLLALSGLHPHERGTWLMEVAPIFLAAPLLVWSWFRFPLTSLLYVLIALHAIILLVGGAYTYARVPLGYWVQDALHLARNPYDRLGHFAQGLVPALIAREVLLRKRIVRPRGWPEVLSIAVALSVSLLYELIEWGAALALGQGADAFLGTQGDPWDTQSDMGMALVGALVAMLCFTRIQDRQRAALAAPEA